MRANLHSSLKLLGTGLMACIVLYSLFGIFSESPSRQKYPDREPIEFWHMWTAEWKVIVEAYCADFNESQNRYEVIPLSIPNSSADSKFLLSVAGGEPPDCMAQWNQVVPQFAERKIIRPVAEIMSPEEYAIFKRTTYPVAQKIANYNGQAYCIPLALNVFACYYNLEHLQQAQLLSEQDVSHLKNPKTTTLVSKRFPARLERLEEWGRRLHVFDEKGRIVRLGFMPQNLMLYAPIFGGGFYNWNTASLQINTPQNRKALNYLTQHRRVLGFERMQRFESALTGNFGADWPFISGKVSIAVDGQWRVQQLEKYAPELAYATTPIPPPTNDGKKEAGWVYSNFMIIPTGAKNPEGAWEFTKFWMGMDDPERAAKFYTESGWLPPNPIIANTQTYKKYMREHPQFQTFIDLLDSPNIEPTPPVPFQLFLVDQIKKTEDSAMRGSMTPEQALEKLERELQVVLQRRRENRNAE